MSCSVLARQLLDGGGNPRCRRRRRRVEGEGEGDRSIHHIPADSRNFRSTRNNDDCHDRSSPNKILFFNIFIYKSRVFFPLLFYHLFSDA